MAADAGITSTLAQFVTESTFESLPPEVVLATKRAWIDTIGVALAGRDEEGSQIALEYAKRAAAGEEATVLGTGTKTTAALAALANGTLGHGLDFDDVSHSLIGHPSVALLPAVLAVAERDGKGGRDAILAFAVGFEITGKLGRAMGRSSYTRGWHATSVVGTIGAAAAVAKLLNLDTETTRHALGIATSMASGTRQNFGSMTKPLHAGLAARAGVEAATLASMGFTADPTALEAPMGFGELYSPAGDWHPELVSEIADPWDLTDPGLCVKQYPCCYNTHLALDAAFDASKRRPFSEADIETIEVSVAEGSTPALIHHRPKLGLEGKFSMEYCVAAAVLDGGVNLASFEDDAVARPEAQSLLRRVEVSYYPFEGDPDRHDDRRAEVTVRLNNGERLHGRVLTEHGSDTDPLTWEELVAKYRDCASVILSAEDVERSLTLLSKLEEQSSLRELMSITGNSAT